MKLIKSILKWFGILFVSFAVLGAILSETESDEEREARVERDKIELAQKEASCVEAGFESCKTKEAEEDRLKAEAKAEKERLKAEAVLEAEKAKLQRIEDKKTCMITGLETCPEDMANRIKNSCIDDLKWPLKYHITQSARDPDSIEFENFERFYNSEDNMAIIDVTYRGRNGFGGFSREKVRGKSFLGLCSAVISVEQIK